MAYLGIDCGGTFIKALLIDEYGNHLGCVKRNIGILSKQAGYAERDMKKLWDVCIEVIQDVINVSKIDNRDIKSIGISGQGKGVFLLDENLEPLGNAILSSDQRSIDIVKMWEKEAIPQKIYPITNQSLWAGHPVSILRWLKENEFARYQKIKHILMSHDYLRFCLTGNIHCEITNISESNLYNIHTKEYDVKLAELFGIEDIFACFPPIIQSRQIAGYVTEEIAKKTGLFTGTPVVGGLFDVISGSLCADLDGEEYLNVILGTWTIVTGKSSHVKENDISLIHCSDDDAFIIHDDSPTSIANLEWFLKQWTTVGYDKANAMVAEQYSKMNSILFIPFLYGSNSKIGMPATLYGLQAHHSQGQLLKAVYEGVIFSFMHHFERMKVAFPSVHILRVQGGIAKSDIWLQMMADISGCQLEVLDIEEIGCFGAAIVAMQGIEVDIKNVKERLHLNKKIFVPDQNHFIQYQEKYNQYLQLVNAMQVLA
ncbi:carbohydrate kinase [Actinobacillus seminis]|uniref:Carbohydrate kinase n=1 Tax=Actinobacillus seminis TaxID=722 RepID=A0A263HDH0_9PAST|nr:FGGY-family carbohydrate kinase [Actinobacillus seminis]OZN24576.1 carbohydrate kinase [Actinobacillus seminis]SUU38123.1 carbohydrate kinase FGGY [Actinobacillus seminis]